MVLPRRRPGPPAAAVVTPKRRTLVAGMRTLGASTVLNSGGAAKGADGLLRVRMTAMVAGASSSPPRHPGAAKQTQDGDHASPTSVADAACRGLRGEASPATPPRGAAAATAPRQRAATPSPGSRPEALLSSTGVHRPSLFNTPVQTHRDEAVRPPRGLSLRAPHGSSASDAGQPGRGSLTLTPAASPPKAVIAIRKAGKLRAKRGLKKAAAVKPADLPVQASDAPPTADFQYGATPLAVPPPVHQIGEPSVPETVTVDPKTRVFAEGPRPVCARLVGLSQELEEVHTSVNRLSASQHTQGVGSERTAQAVVQLQGAVTGVFDGVVGLVKKESVAVPALRLRTAMLDDC